MQGEAGAARPLQLYAPPPAHVGVPPQPSQQRSPPPRTELPLPSVHRHRPAVEHTAGICRIVPPAAWVEGVADAFAIDRASLKFNARVQRVDQLQRKHTAVASQRFWNEYHAWMAANGIKRKGGKLNPVFNGQEIELDRFHSVVARRGGYEAVTEDKSWREIANVLDVSGIRLCGGHGQRFRGTTGAGLVAGLWRWGTRRGVPCLAAGIRSAACVQLQMSSMLPLGRSPPNNCPPPLGPACSSRTRLAMLPSRCASSMRSC